MTSKNTTFKAAEDRLLQNIKDHAKPHQALWELAQFYKVNHRQTDATNTLQKLLALTADPEEIAQCVFTLGQCAEQRKDYPAAIGHYKQALELEPVGQDVWYFVLNNLGYCHNQLGQFAEGERYCRLAIQVTEERANAFKNLGLALAGQGRQREAGQSYVRATEVCPLDGRALDHLQELIREHPELVDAFGSDLKK